MDKQQDPWSPLHRGSYRRCLWSRSVNGALHHHPQSIGLNSATRPHLQVREAGMCSLTQGVEANLATSVHYQGLPQPPKVSMSLHPVLNSSASFYTTYQHIGQCWPSPIFLFCRFFFFFFFLTTPCGMWDLSSLTRDRTCAPCIGSAES